MYLKNKWYKLASTYWGAAAAGCLFICLEDKTILLFERSDEVEQPGTWGVSGGAVKEKGELFLKTKDNKNNIEDNSFNSTAIEETTEEAGSFPENAELVDYTDFTDKSFTFRTYIYNISLEEKNKWTPTIVLNWENNSCKWYNINNLPGNMHFGVKEKIGEIIRLFINK